MANRTCSIDYCDNRVLARGWCSTHYSRWRRGLDLEAPLSRDPKGSAGPCSIATCDLPAKSRGWCSKHYMRWQRHGDPESLTPPRPLRLCEAEGCASPHVARGFCNRHYLRWVTYGDPHHERTLQRSLECTIDGCTAPRVGRTWCNKHWNRWRKHGDPTFTGRHSGPPLEETFWKRVEKSPDGCWHWIGYTNADGYGRLAAGDALDSAHRVAWQLLIGPIPKGRHLDHRRTCEKRCVNPEHLRVVTPKQNIENRAGLRKDNTSGYTGVSWNRALQKWAATVRHNRKDIHAGFYGDVEHAAEAVLRLRLELFTHNDIDRESRPAK